MLKGYGRAGDLGGAELMYELVANDRDQKADVVALNSLLDACVRNGDLRRAVEILEQVSPHNTGVWGFVSSIFILTNLAVSSSESSVEFTFLSK